MTPDASVWAVRDALFRRGPMTADRLAAVLGASRLKGSRRRVGNSLALAVRKGQVTESGGVYSCREDPGPRPWIGDNSTRYVANHQKVLDAVRSGMATRREVAEAVGITKTSAAKHLRLLEAEGLVRSDVSRTPWRYKPREGSA